MAIIGIDALMKELSQSTYIYSGDESSVLTAIPPIQEGIGNFMGVAKDVVDGTIRSILNEIMLKGKVLPLPFYEAVEAMFDKHDNFMDFCRRLSIRLMGMYAISMSSSSDFKCDKEEMESVISATLTDTSSSLSVKVTDELVSRLAETFCNGFDEDSLVDIFERDEYDKFFLSDYNVDVAISSRGKGESALSILDLPSQYPMSPEFDYSQLDDAVMFMDIVTFIIGRSDFGVVHDIIDKKTDVYELLNSMREEYDEGDIPEITKSKITDELISRLRTRTYAEINDAFFSSDGIIQYVLAGEIAFSEYMCPEMGDDGFALGALDITAKVSSNGHIEIDTPEESDYRMNGADAFVEKLKLFRALFSDDNGEVSIVFESNHEQYIVKDVVRLSVALPDVYFDFYNSRLDEEGNLYIDFSISLKS